VSGADASLLDDLVAAVDAAADRCDLVEARRVVTATEHLAVRDGALDAMSLGEDDGVGVRVRVAGRWGFASTSDPSRAAIEAAILRALAFADAQPRPPGGGGLTAVEPATGHWAAPYQIDPFSITPDAKLELLLAADAGMRADGAVGHTSANCLAIRTTSALATSEGTAITQVRNACGASIQALAADDVDAQTRSYPGAHDGGVGAGGWEIVEAFDLVGHAPRVGSEAVELLTAPVCPPGRTTLVLHGEQVALQVHESIGHALELDRILGGEASYAGTSWVTADALRTGVRYGSDLLTITADATLPGGLGTFGWDDEGVPARRIALIDAGILRAALSARESAAAIGLTESGGCARAEGHTRQPIVRMTNVSIEHGDAGTLTDLIAETDEGLYCETNRSWSIDDRRLHFQFATEVGREIRDGELGRLVKSASYAGVTPQFWSSLDAVCGPEDWRPWGLLNCGKGEPGQTMQVSHGAAAARFRDVQVGVA